MIIGKEVLKIQDKLFIVNRKIAEHQDVDVKWFRFKTGSEKVFRAQGFYYFVDEIKDVEPIPETQLHLEFPQ
jgi:hypothetical protein